MKRIAILIAVLVVTMGIMSPVMAESGNVTYSGDAGDFIFEPGSDHSPSDLFPNFKDVMPGDTLTQQITVKNNASDRVYVKIYMRALGAHEDSKEFLSQLGLSVNCEDNSLFDAAADQTAQLTDWVLLGTLYSGGSVDLDVTLHVPGELDNKFRNLVGKLDWEFMVKEFPVEDPTQPTETDDDKDKDKGTQTGDDFAAYKWLIVMAGAGAVMIVLIRRRKNEES